uniref:Carboxypeptidase n=1 Tax=Hirondellea gigas TaxID=1518452 RepID=A0A2P2I9L8_9CRUS
MLRWLPYYLRLHEVAGISLIAAIGQKRFIESIPDTTAPLLLWLNGGPGCSSMDGLLTELGPFYVNLGGETLYENPSSWNTFANIMYLESPACVGYSYNTERKCKASDYSTAEDNYLALKEFFTRFPNYRDSPFYVTGESYGGIYIPTLAVKIVENLDDYPLNLQGYAIGNGLNSYSMNDNSLVFFAKYHGLVGEILWDDLVTNCCTDGVPSQEACHFSNSESSDCAENVNQVFTTVYNSGLNMYGLYADCIMDDERTFTRYDVDMMNLFRNSKLTRQSGSRGSERSNIPCLSTNDTTHYLNKAEVRKALHIPDSLFRWEVCSDIVAALFERNYEEMSAEYWLLHDAGIRGLVYSGDTDMACNFIGGEWFVDSLGFDVVSPYTKWMFGDQVAGFVKTFDLLDFVTLKGSGHMVPQDRPKESLYVIKAFIYKTPY